MCSSNTRDKFLKEIGIWAKTTTIRHYTKAETETFRQITLHQLSLLSLKQRVKITNNKDIWMKMLKNFYCDRNNSRWTRWHKRVSMKFFTHILKILTHILVNQLINYLFKTKKRNIFLTQEPQANLGHFRAQMSCKRCNPLLLKCQ